MRFLIIQVLVFVEELFAQAIRAEKQNDEFLFSLFAILLDSSTRSEMLRL